MSLTKEPFLSNSVPTIPFLFSLIFFKYTVNFRDDELAVLFLNILLKEFIAAGLINKEELKQAEKNMEVKNGPEDSYYFHLNIIKMIKPEFVKHFYLKYRDN